MKQKGRIVLGSASPRRREMLEGAGLTIEVRPSDVAEVGFGGDPALLPLRVARQKLKAVRSLLGPSFDGWIVCADTVVALDRDVFGKPENATQGQAMLRRLSGRTHQVYTGYRVERFDGDFREETIRTDVEFGTLSDAWIDAYVASGEPNDKAGAYAVQGKAGLFIQRLTGSYTNVVGLPLLELLKALKELDAIEDV